MDEAAKGGAFCFGNLGLARETKEKNRQEIYSENSPYSLRWIAGGGQSLDLFTILWYSWGTLRIMRRIRMNINWPKTCRKEANRTKAHILHEVVLATGPGTIPACETAL